jgi:hypothetical protein
VSGDLVGSETEGIRVGVEVVGLEVSGEVEGTFVVGNWVGEETVGTVEGSLVVGGLVPSMGACVGMTEGAREGVGMSSQQMICSNLS